MVFNFRQPVRRRYTSSLRGKIALTREYYYSLFTTLVVKIMLFIFLWMLFASAIRVMRKSFKNISDTWRLVMPTAIAAVALLIGYHIYKNIKEIVRYNKELSEARKTNAPR
jgi:low affinity Fe/Cu permease